MPPSFFPATFLISLAHSVGSHKMMPELIKYVLEPAMAGTMPEDIHERIASFQESSMYSNAWAEFTGVETSVSATSSLYDGVRNTLIAEHDGWSAFLVQPAGKMLNATFAGIENSVTTPSSFNLVYIIDAPEELILQHFDLLDYPTPGDLPGAVRPSLKFEEVVTKGSVFCLKSGNHASVLKGAIERCKFLRFCADTEVPFIYSFFLDLMKLKSVSFSTTEMTSDHFFAILVAEVCDSKETAPLDQDYMANYLRTLAINRDINVATRWKALQAAAKRSKDVGMSILRHMKEEPLPNLASVATNVLTRTVGR